MKYHLFEVYGIELEYMVVQKKSLSVAPVVDQLLMAKAGKLVSDVDNGEIEWSNELVAHVVELKTNGPTAKLEGLADVFHRNILEVQEHLEPIECKLLPTASHPFMDPKTEMQLWKHSYSKVYALYNRIFNCHGHGWANVQSMHLNLPFYNDDEFEKLHAAIRLILPIIPGLCASSPIFDGKKTGFLDSRLEVYKNNQKEIPQMTGKVIPERVFTKKDYYEVIFEPINEAIRPHDYEHILDHHFLNSRGAIARFDRNAIEIRLIDIQECPKADIAIAALIIEVLKAWVQGEWISLEKQKTFDEDKLLSILNKGIKFGEQALVENLDYLSIFGCSEATSMGDLWQIAFDEVSQSIPVEYIETLKFILKEGTLSTRILKALGNDPTQETISSLYEKLAICLEENALFVP